METITIPRQEFEQMIRDNKKLKQEVESLRSTNLYKRLLECLDNLKVREYTRKDLGI
ncbi:MAG: hypothetical protein AABX04_07510 [Nanoarchaeota archaeon]